MTKPPINQQNKACRRLLIAGLLLTFFSFSVKAQDQEKVVYFEEDFETDLINWKANIIDGSIDIVDNVDGDGKVLRMVSANDAQNTLATSLQLPTPNDETFYIEYDYRTASIDGKWDNMQINGATPARLQTSLRQNTGTYIVHDNDMKQSGSPAGTIAADTWYHIKVTVDPVANTAQMSIDGTDYAAFTSGQDLKGFSTFLMKVLISNTFYVDNFIVYTYGEELPEEAEIPQPPSDHPRVMLRPTDLPMITERYNAANMSAFKDLLLKDEAKGLDFDISEKGVIYDAYYRELEAAAFLYLLDKQGALAKGEKAKNGILTYLRTARQLQEGNQDRQIHRAIFTAAFVYDWCYELFTEAEKLALIADVKRLAATTEYGYPMVGDQNNYLINHFGEEKIPHMLGFGIACYDEDPTIYEHIGGHLYNGLVPSRNFFYPSHKHHQGSAYGMGRYEMEIMSTFIMTRMGAERPYIDEQQMVPYSQMYARRPDGTVMTAGDDFNYDLPSTKPYIQIVGAMMAANEFQDEYIQDEVERYTEFMDYFQSIKQPVLIILSKDHKLTTKSITDLPLTKYFNSPNSSMIARTGWDPVGGKTSGVAMALMNLGEYHYNNHDHYDAGHFSLYYKGPLAMDAGAYANSEEGPKHGGKSGHWASFYTRTIAHNTILVRDPDEPFQIGTTWDGQNEGGQHAKVYPKSYKDLVSAGRQTEVLAHEFGPSEIEPDYSYLKGDMANAYTYPGRAPKVLEAKRSFVFLNLKNEQHPAALLVYDKVTSGDKTFKKRWILHSDPQPVVKGKATTITRTDNGFGGKMVNHTLLPALDNTEFNLVGGPGKEFWTESGGRNWGLEDDNEIKQHEAGRWRVELSPKQEADTDHFLNVMQVMDAEGNVSELESTLLESDSLFAVAIADRVVAFAKSGFRESNQRHFKMKSSNETIKVLITDLKEGEYDVYGPTPHKSLKASAEAGTIYFEGKAGNYIIVRAGEEPEDILTSTTPVDPSRVFAYPNPANGKLYIQGTLERVQLLDFNGQQMDIQQIDQEIDISKVKPGMYILTGYSGTGVVSQKVIIQ